MTSRSCFSGKSWPLNIVMSRKSIDESEEVVVNLIFGCKESSLLRNVLRFWCLGHIIRMSSMYLGGFGWLESVIFCRHKDVGYGWGKGCSHGNAAVLMETKVPELEVFVMHVVL